MYQIKVFASLQAKRVGDYKHIYRGCRTLKECEAYKQDYRRHEDSGARFTIEKQPER